MSYTSPKPLYRPNGASTADGGPVESKHRFKVKELAAAFPTWSNDGKFAFHLSQTASDYPIFANQI
jgi:hypothetical protein